MQNKNKKNPPVLISSPQRQVAALAVATATTPPSTLIKRPSLARVAESDLAENFFNASQVEWADTNNEHLLSMMVGKSKGGNGGCGGNGSALQKDKSLPAALGTATATIPPPTTIPTTNNNNNH